MENFRLPDNSLKNSQSPESFTSDSIAIIGMACRLPGASNYHALWDVLSSAGSTIRPIPSERWDSDYLYHTDRKHPGTTVSRQAGLLDDIQAFDAAFFGISPREARSMDPQQRLLLEETWHALEDAGLSSEALHGRRVGVYAASMANDYLQHTASPFRPPDAYFTLGVSAALLANRLSAFFGWRGESVTVDTACASSITALHQARLALLNDTADYCIVAGANALISPWKTVSFSQAGMLSADGLCKTFADNADGYVPGEGAVVLVLRRTCDALSSGNRIHGLLLGTAINHMGSGNAITAPSVEAETEVIRAALAQARIDPSRLSYVECHGTGTALGDPIEVEALVRALSEGVSGNRSQATLIGSIKSNIGHLEAAAGLAGIIKVLLMLRHGQIPATLNLAADNPLIDFSSISLQPARTLTPWQDNPKLAGVSAFGFGGAGGHAILAEPPRVSATTAEYAPPDPGFPVTLTLSAHDDITLKALASTLAIQLQQPTAPDLTTWARALALQRSSLTQRLAITARNKTEAVAALQRPDLLIHTQPATAPDLTLHVHGDSAIEHWQNLRHRLPGLERLVRELTIELKTAGIDIAFPAVNEFIVLRAFLKLLQLSGVETAVWCAFGSARPAVLAAAGVAGNAEAAYLAYYGKVTPAHWQRPATTYRDGDTGLELKPVRIDPSELETLATADVNLELIKLAQQLWRGNYTFRALLEEWRELLGCGAGADMLAAPWSKGLNLAVAVALWTTCSRWSLRPPSVAVRWSAWPLAMLVGDGLLDRKHALDIINQERPLSTIAEALAELSRRPDPGRHPWLDRQRAYLPELADLKSPLDSPKLPTPDSQTDIALVIGSSPSLDASVTAKHLLYFDPETGGNAVESLLAKLWHHGMSVHQRALELPCPPVDLPLYPFNRKAYWLPRLPEADTVVLWETGRSYQASDSAGKATEPSPNLITLTPTTAHAPDWLERIRTCVAVTLEADPEEIDPERPLASQGIDSLISMDLSVRIQRETGVKLSPAVLEELGNVAAIAARIAQSNPVMAPPPPSRTETATRPAASTRQIQASVPGLLDSITIVERLSLPPDDGEVQIRVRAAGLNFRDLMIALDALPEARGEAMGLEFCGEIEALGAGVTGYRVGDRVLGIALGALSDRIVTPASLIAPAPLPLSDAECAGLPIVYLTVLRCLAGIKSGQSILIHAAAGGLGQAAVHLAQAADLVIFATAGSPEKRQWLQTQGIRHVMDSRRLDFADEIMRITEGHGVDWVLNSLTGDAVDCGLACLAPGGHFIEVGKTDIRDGQVVARQYPDIHYRIYDLVAEIRSQPETIGEQLRALLTQINQQTLGVLATETFPFSLANMAFQHMARARHRGKIVLLNDQSVSARAQANSDNFPNTQMPLAVVGMSGRFPGAGDCDTLWQVLATGQPTFGKVPEGRWTAREFAACAHDIADPDSLNWGGFLADAEQFDHAFFGFSPREARATDPRQRLLLEETWKALHDAGLIWNGPGDSLRNARIGIFVAADAGDYGFKRAVNGAKSDQLALAGNLPSSLAARLAHIFDCDGLTLTVDLACASSMGALWAAQQALAKGDCHYAVVAAVSLHSTPLLASQLAAAGLLSAQGKCQPFTRLADGLIPSEACVSLILQPLANAREQTNTVLAVIDATVLGHDGQGKGFTLPSSASLANLQANALRQAGLDVGQIDLISAHGVGTPGGDAAEIAALAQTFAKPSKPLPLTTVKPVIGHTLAAAGLTAVVHAILQLRHNRLLAVGLDAASAIPECTGDRFYLAESRPWLAHRDGSPRRVLIDTFAINGNQGATIVSEAPVGLSRSLQQPNTPPLQRRRFWLDEPLMEPCSETPNHEQETVRLFRQELSAVLQEPADSLDLGASPIALGLSSLLAIELQHRLQRRFGVSLSLAQLLGASRMDALLAELVVTGHERPNPVSDDPSPFAAFPLTELQAAYWSGRQADVPLGGVDCQVYWEFECAQDWSSERLETAWNRLVKLHPMLRAVVDANARQRVLPDVPDYRFEVMPLTAMTAAEQREAMRERLRTAEIDPGQWPLFRLAFSTVGNSRRLHCAINLLVMDVLSLYSLLDQLAALADDPHAMPLPPPLTFKQCLQAMDKYIGEEAMRESAAFWAERALTLPSAPQLPMLKPLASMGRLSTRRLQARLPLMQWQHICTGAQNHNLSQSVVVLAALAGTLAHWSNTPCFTLNLTTHTRHPIHPDINRVVGNFTGTVLLDMDVRVGETFRELAGRIGKRLLEHLDHAHYPSVQIMRKRAATLGWGEGIMPVVFTSMLGYEGLRQGHGLASPFGVLEYGSTRTPQVTLDAQVQTDSHGLLLSWDVAEGIFPEGLPDAVFSAWVDAIAALDSAIGWDADIPARIAQREAEQRALANSDIGPIPDEPLFAPFIRQAQAHPERIAIIAPDRRLCYGELLGICAGFSARLREFNVRPGELVAVAMDKGWRQIMAAIAVQMAGAAYLPLAPDLPPARFTRLAERGRIHLGLTETDRKLAWPAEVKVLFVGADAQPAATPPTMPTIDPDSLAYVIFTSGSTGEPKGVMLTHRAALNTCLDINRRFQVGADDKVLALSALSFDLSVWDIFGLLAAGGAVVLPKPASANDPAHLAELMREHRISIWNSVPMYLELFLAGQPASENLTALRTVMLSGDWLALDLATRLRHLAPQARVHSLGGATEAAIWSIHYPIDDVPKPRWTSVPYGRAMDNQDMQIWDAQLAPCPDFVAGDLYIGGIGLALGYWDDQERTAAAFITHPQTGERLYRTGDLARWREDGLIEFLGRRDGQVKIDGFRVELGEIEAVLRTHPLVREAVAVAPADPQGRRRLAVFCVANAASISTGDLLEHLRLRLPVYMVPRELRVLERLPLTENEKVDRRTLANWAFRDDTTPIATSAEPQDTDALQQRLLALWENVLNNHGIACHQLDPQRNLFEVGADSLMAVVASRRIANELGIACSVTEIFEHGTIAGLAQALVRRVPQAQTITVVTATQPNKPRADMRRAFRSSMG